jgi:hypothetical protein
MSRIIAIEEAIKDRLGAELTGIPLLARDVDKGASSSVVVVPMKIESFPDRLTADVLKSLAAAGSILVRYVGSRYGKLTGAEQSREMIYEVSVFSVLLKASNAHYGCYSMIDAAASRLIGYKPPHCNGSIELVTDSFVEEYGGAWQYVLQIKVTTPVVQFIEEYPGAPLRSVTAVSENG